MKRLTGKACYLWLGGKTMIYIKSVRLTELEASELMALGFIIEMDSVGHHNKPALFSVFVAA